MALLNFTTYKIYTLDHTFKKIDKILPCISVNHSSFNNIAYDFTEFHNM